MANEKRTPHRAIDGQTHPKPKRTATVQFTVEFPKEPDEDESLALLRWMWLSYGTGEPILRAIVYCQERQRPLPKWLIDQLAVAARRYLVRRSTKGRALTMDQALHLAAEPAKRDPLRRAREEMLFDGYVGIVIQLMREMDPGTGERYTKKAACKAALQLFPNKVFSWSTLYHRVRLPPYAQLMNLPEAP